MAIDSSKIILGLPSLPNEELPANLYNELLTVHKAIKNLLGGVSVYCGVDPVDVDERADSPPSETILSGNLTRMYPIAAVAINAGQLVNLYDNAGVINARLSDATTPTKMAHGICNETVGIGGRFEMQWLRGYVTSIGGMVIGTVYWTSTTPGAIQNLPPAVPGQIQQQVGLAIGATALIMDIPLQYRVV